ncbi:TPA: colicin-like pore-forming protein, partial [Escherichia coli]
VNWKGPKYNNKLVKRFVSQFLLFRKEEKEKNEKEALLKASELVSGMGDKLGEYLGVKYKNVAKEVANDIKNFHGRNIRSYNEAMASLNKVLANPKMKVNKSDKDAIVNAWKQVNAKDMANKIGNLGKAFKVADLAIKVEKIREKSIEGYNTGNWGPLLLEVESWIIGGVVAGVAISLFGAVLSFLPISGLAVTALGVIGIMTISYLSSFIDANRVSNINNIISSVIR